MKKVLKPSLLTVEISVFAMPILLHFADFSICILRIILFAFCGLDDMLLV